MVGPSHSTRTARDHPDCTTALLCKASNIRFSITIKLCLYVFSPLQPEGTEVQWLNCSKLNRTVACTDLLWPNVLFPETPCNLYPWKVFRCYISQRDEKVRITRVKSGENEVNVEERRIMGDTADREGVMSWYFYPSQLLRNTLYRIWELHFIEFEKYT